MLFKPRMRRDDFEREVQLEMDYVRDMHGDSAAEVARQRAARRGLGARRRRVIEEAARRLGARKGSEPEDPKER